jgi:hypothetical protein
VKLDPGAHVFYAFGFALKSGCDILAFELSIVTAQVQPVKLQ